MANISALGTQATSLTSNLLTALGVSGWVLQDGKYNGCTFASFVKVPLVQNNPLVESGTDLFASINEITGFTYGEDANSFGKLTNTIMGSLQYQDIPERQIAVKQIPFSDRCNTEDMGSGGYTFKMSIIFLGTDYQKALRNFENAINTSPKNPKDNLVLIHPVRGRIPGITRLLEAPQVTIFSKWNAATLNITFRSEQTNLGTSKATLQSEIQQYTNAIQAGLGVVTGLTTTAANFQAAVNSNGRVPTGQTSNVTYTKSSNLQTQANKLSDTLLNNINYIYKVAGQPTFQPTLSSLPIDYSKIPPSLNQSVKYASSQIAIINSFYRTQAQDLLLNLQISGFGAATNDLANQIYSSISILQNIAVLAIAVSPSINYSVPYNMSIRTALINNGIGLNQTQIVLNNNPHILSANFIEAATVLKL